MSENVEIWEDHWANFARAFVQPLQGGGLLSRFVSNSDVTGSYAEAWVRSLIASMLPQFRISTGAIIRPMDRKQRDLSSIPQLDAIIWDPSELPALFEQGDFALVPFHSARAVIEIKRTCSSIGDFRDQLRRQQQCLKHGIRSNVLGVVISHGSSIFDGEVEPSWLEQDKWQDSPAMTRLLCEDLEVDVDGVFVLIYFLAQIAGRRSPV
jgi:hypothetical protein